MYRETFGRPHARDPGSSSSGALPSEWARVVLSRSTSSTFVTVHASGLYLLYRERGAKNDVPSPLRDDAGARSIHSR